MTTKLFGFVAQERVGRHPHAVHLRAHFEDEGHFYLVMECVRGGYVVVGSFFLRRSCHSFHLQNQKIDT